MTAWKDGGGVLVAVGEEPESHFGKGAFLCRATLIQGSIRCAACGEDAIGVPGTRFGQGKTTILRMPPKRRSPGNPFTRLRLGFASSEAKVGCE